MRPVTAVVLPSLNEESNLKATSESLGFCESHASHQSTNLLFIIDNGSTDGTLEVAREIQHRSGRNSVFIAQEPERGYVPPRHTGNMIVKSLAEQRGLDLSDVLVLQADADTLYAEGYVDRMSNASASSGQGGPLLTVLGKSMSAKHLRTPQSEKSWVVRSRNLQLPASRERAPGKLNGNSGIESLVLLTSACRQITPR